MFGQISNKGIAIGIGLIVVGAVIAWIWLGDTELGESPVDEAAGMEELTVEEDEQFGEDGIEELQPEEVE